MSEVFSIAEIGVNHMGSFEKALEMLKQAKDCGASAVKFQKYNPVKVLGKNSPYLNDAHQLSWAELSSLSSNARLAQIQFGVSVFDVNDIPIADAISDYHKIATRMNFNREFIARIERCKKPTYVSIQPDTEVMPDRFKLMWCIKGEYPSTKEAILSYPYKGYGLSSHCPDPSATLEAVRAGARTIENHICVSKLDRGCDISSSLDFSQYRGLLAQIKTLDA